jgi:hypothetical protein
VRGAEGCLEGEGQSEGCRRMLAAARLVQRMCQLTIGLGVGQGHNDFFVSQYGFCSTHT